MHVVILVPGLIGIHIFPRWMQPALKKLFFFLNERPIFFDHQQKWEKLFNKENMYWLHWNRGVNRWVTKKAVKKLKVILSHHQKDDVSLVGFSKGGQVVLETLRSKPENVKQVILVCSLNDMENINKYNAEVFNIYSPKDNVITAGIRLFYHKKGSKHLKGEKVHNITIPDMDHYGFCNDETIKAGDYKGQKPSEIVYRLLHQEEKEKKKVYIKKKPSKRVKKLGK